MSTSSTVSAPPSTAAKPPVSSAPTPSPKRAASRLAPGTKAFIRQMADNLRTHDPEAPKGRLKAQA